MVRKPTIQRQLQALVDQSKPTFCARLIHAQRIERMGQDVRAIHLPGQCDGGSAQRVCQDDIPFIHRNFGAGRIGQGKLGTLCA